MPSYGQFVFNAGRFVGDFETMYRVSKDIPWHQDKTNFSLHADIDLFLLRHLIADNELNDIIDYGCGLGYFTKRLAASLNLPVKIIGYDISSTVIQRAIELNGHRNIQFIQYNLIAEGMKMNHASLFYCRDIFWYIQENLDLFFDRLDTDYFYISNAFPDLEDYHGKERFPNPESVIHFLNKYFDPIFANVENNYAVNQSSKLHGYNKEIYVRYIGKKALNR